MPGNELNGVMRRLRRLAAPGQADAPTDSQLVEDFLVQRDELAFETLVRRHGPMVLSVCRRVLGDFHDAEDAFQATFLVFARRAGRITQRERVGSWLYCVAQRTAQRARLLANRRSTKLKQVPDMAASVPPFDSDRHDLQPLMDEELGRLPEKYRLPIVLCDLEGQTRSAVAQQLALPQGTLSSRLARGRQLLARRLSKRGLALSAVGLAEVLLQTRADASLPRTLLRSTVRAGMAMAAGKTLTAALVSSRVATLTEGVLNTMWLTRLKIGLAALVLGLLVLGAGLFAKGREPEPAKEPAAAPAAAKALTPRSVILLWMAGGPSQMDTFDLKPGTPNGGPFKEIDTAAKDIRISEHLPKIARFTDQMVVIRSMTHRQGGHDSGGYLMQTGYSRNAAIDYPAMGAVLARELDKGQSKLPPFVGIGPVAAGAGFLDARYAPALMTGAEALQNPKLPRWEAAEEEKARDRYGRNPFGEGCLAARRLVEAGVPFVQVTQGGWDTHGGNFEIVKARCEVLDMAWSALMADLRERGLLDTTLVVWMGEFGRTPRINQGQGRDHWSLCFSAVLAGGGIRGGQVIGRTSADGTKIEERPVTVPELWATICKVSGVDHSKRHKSNQDVMVSLVEAGTQPLQEVISGKNKRIGDLIGQLGSPDFQVRQQATDELEKFGAGALPALRRALDARLALEVNKRAESLIRRIETNEAQAADLLEKRWSALGGDRHALKIRLGKVLRINPQLTDQQLIAAVFLLTLGRIPATKEMTQAEQRFKQGFYHPQVLFDLAWELVHSAEFNAELASVNARLLALQGDLNKGLEERLKLANGNNLQEALRDSGRKLAGAIKANRDLADHVFLIAACRFPSGTEVDHIEKHLQAGKDDRSIRIAEVLTALMLSSELMVQK
jgi:RNA polymerase sigma factor (sigma-70 family)